MTYKESVDYLNEQIHFVIRPGLTVIRELLKQLDNPQDGLRYIHIAGTNGKGSTASYIENVLRAAGYRTGLFTSPYIDHFSEKIRVDGEEIDESIIIELTSKVRAAADAISREELYPTPFELQTAVAFLYFQKMNCDIVVLETGLGGRLDATNIIREAEVSVITSISFDHMDYLGDTLPEIAVEKAGIIKKNGRVVSYPQRAEAMVVIEGRAKEMGAALYSFNFEDVDVVESGLYRQVFCYEKEWYSAYLSMISGSLAKERRLSGNERLSDRNNSVDNDAASNGAGSEDRDSLIEIPKLKNDPDNLQRQKLFEIHMLGQHQIYNAALAVMAIEILNTRGFGISDESIRQGLINTRWQGRLELMHERPLLLIDGAHNPDGVEALAKSLSSIFPGRKLTFVTGVLKDKDYRTMLKYVIPLARQFYTVTPDSIRALPAEELAAELVGQGCQAMAFSSVKEALDQCLSLPEDEIICAFGSLYYIGEIRGLLKLSKYSD